jgi:hypothetical protein
MPKGEETFAEMCERLKKGKEPETRRLNAIPERHYFLIVSEGAKTEPIYFQYFKDRLPRNSLDMIEIEPGGVETIRVVELAIQKRKERKQSLKPPYDEVWAVFDKDDFPDENFNGAIDLAEQVQIRAAASNEAFELWYVLHFHYLDTAIKRQQYFEILTKLLGFPYEKNSAKVVEHLFEKGDFRQAIKWAKKLEAMHQGKPKAGSCPYTGVYVLVRRLAVYLGMIEPEPEEDRRTDGR